MAGALRRHLADTTPLRTPAFARLFYANVVTVIGAQLTVVAVPAQIFSLTDSSAYVGLTGLFGLVPLVVFGLYGGALADHLDRRLLLILTTVGIVATSLAFFVQAALGARNVWLLLGIFAVQQAFFAVNQPVRSSILPKLLPLDQLPAAQALSMTVLSFGAIAGPLAGGALIPLLGFPALYLIDTVCLLATLYAVVRLPSLPVENASGTPGLRSVLEGLAHLRGRTVLLMSFVVDLIAMIFGLARTLFPQIAHETFGGPVEGGLAFSLLYASMPVGVLLGGVFSGCLQVIFIVVVAGGPRVADVLHGLAADRIGTAWAAGGGGLAVLVLLALVTLAAPAFWRYRLAADAGG